MTTYPSPGRGAWTRTGGLLPGKPGGSGTFGYYRLNAPGESAVGSTWSRQSDPSHHAECVWYGVQALQTLVGAQVDGWLGAETSGRLIAAQARAGIEADGVGGPATMRALLSEAITHTANVNLVPTAFLGGVLVNESNLDPAAVGVNGQDHGIAQINLSAHPEVSLAQAMDPGFSMVFTAAELFHCYSVWDGRTRVNPWVIAIANHNSPALARAWAVAGAAPVVAGRVFQIADYVDKVLSAW